MNPPTADILAPEMGADSAMLAGAPVVERIIEEPSGIGWGGIVIIGIALILRIWALDLKPPHFDEGINGWFVDQMQMHGFYEYDPKGYHGPSHFYALFISLSLFGRDLIALRLPAVLASTLSVVAMLCFARIFNRSACRLAALCMAISPAFVFYGRYSIHENWLLLSLLVTVLGWLTLWKEGSSRALWMLGMGFTGMVLTKETYVIHAGCLLLAWTTLVSYESRSASIPNDAVARRKWTMDDLISVLAVGLGLVLFFYSGTFLNWPGLAGLFLTFREWVQTGLGGDHGKGPLYWIDLLGRYEWPAVLGLLAASRYLLPSERKARFVAIYGTGVLAAYSLITYKTPWCILVILWPFYLTLGLVLVELKRRSRWFSVLWILPSAALCASAWETVQLNFYRYVDEKHPYVYVQTYPSISEITAPILALAKDRPENLHITGNVMMESSFPLPWLLGEFDRFGYYPRKKPATSCHVAVLIVDDVRIGEIEAMLTDRYFTRHVRVRPGVGVKLYLREEEFAGQFPGQKPDFDPAPKLDGPIEIRKALPVEH